MRCWPTMSDARLFPTLTTDRLLLRQPNAEDAADVLVFRGDPEVQRFNSEPHTNRAQSVELIEELRREYEEGTGVVWAVAVVATGRVVGFFGFSAWDRYHRRAEVGYDLARDHWGKGVAREALTAALNYGFGPMGLHRIEAMTIADNHASTRLLDGLGFVREGTRRACSWEEDGTFHDSAIYGLLNYEWPVLASPRE
jgi:[ribosomal protein S5]-alanine N-acetyltransferase